MTLLEEVLSAVMFVSLSGTVAFCRAYYKRPAQRGANAPFDSAQDVDRPACTVTRAIAFAGSPEAAQCGGAADSRPRAFVTPAPGRRIAPSGVSPIDV